MQAQQKQKQPAPRWRMSIGEWVILLVNLLLAGLSGVLGWSKILDGTSHVDRLFAGSALVIALGAGLTCLLLLLRQTRLAAWFQWLVALGFILFSLVYFVYGRQYASLKENLLTLGIALLLAVLFLVSGRFLRTVDNET